MARKSRKGAGRAAAPTQNKRIWNCAVYVRLSHEDSGRGTIEAQAALVTSYVAQRADLALVDTYTDNGASGKDFNRPAWTRLMGDIKKGRIDCVCVKDLSRFSRNYIETYEYIEKIFPLMGVRFLSVNDKYDSRAANSAYGLVVALKSLVHALYIKDISRKTSAAFTARRARGEYIGAFAPFGYVKSSEVKGLLVPDLTTAPAICSIFKWRAGGMSRGEICKKLEDAGIPCPSMRLRQIANVRGTDYYRTNAWAPRAIKRIIRNPVYLGHLTYSKTRCNLAENMHMPLVCQKLWDAANAVEVERGAKYGQEKR